MSGSTLDVFFSPQYIGAACQFDTLQKGGWIAESLRQRPIPGIALREPKPLIAEQLHLIHDPAYVAAVRAGEPRWLAESSGLEWDARLWEAVCSSNGGALEAALEAYRTGRNTGSLTSGLHHARAASGCGFCTFNGLALAARGVLDAGAERVLVIDLDAHHGGGTFDILSHIPDVALLDKVVLLDIGVSAADGYEPPRGSLSTVDTIRNADAYLPTLRQRLASLSEARFDVVLYGAGMDPHQASLGGLSGITFDLLAQREEIVFEWARNRGVGVAFVLLGGYLSADLTRDDLVGLHRLTLAAAAQANATERLFPFGIREAAYAGPHKGTEGFSFDENGRKTDAGFHAEMLGDEDNDPYDYDGDELLKLSPEAQRRFITERNHYPWRQAEFMQTLRREATSGGPEPSATARPGDESEKP